jgi:uncharacterized membrane protein YbjE (DUF340 family)
MILGTLAVKKLPTGFTRRAAIIQNLTLFGLLFFLGVEIGSIDGILDQLVSIGSISLCVGSFSVAGSCLVGFLASLLFDRKSSSIIDDKGKTFQQAIHVSVRDVNELYGEKPSKEKKNLHSILKHIFLIIREPLLFLSIVFLGLICRLLIPSLPFSDSIISYLLYALLFFSGMGIGSSGLSLKKLLASPWMLLLPLWTVLGTYLGALLVPFFCNLTLSQALGISSGFGWYSLSGVMIANLGFPVLGSISFLSNVFRESLSFFLIPMFAHLGRFWFYPAVCAGGATTMDVTLPLLSSRFGSALAIPSLYHGLMTTILAPLLISVFF